MIINKHSLGPSKRATLFSQGGSARFESSTQTQYVLTNSDVRFVFEEDPVYGAYLKSFSNNSAGAEYANSTHHMWEILLRESYNKNGEETLRTVYPTADVSIAGPVSIGSGKQRYTFTWDNVQYDYINKSKTARVEVTATIQQETDYVEFGGSITETSGLSLSELSTGSTVLQFKILPISVKATESLAESPVSLAEDDVFLVSSQMGDCTRNPIRNLVAPRFDSEDILFKQFGPDGITQNYKFRPTNETVNNNTRMINLGNPGFATMPLMAFGNRELKQGFLYYAYDVDMTHAKNIIASSDGTRMHMSIADWSDSQYDPNGVGGYWTDGNVSFANTQYTPGWTVRIQPFISSTKWVDWHAPILYKNSVIPDLELSGSVGPSFYSRAQSNTMDISSSEMPYYLTTSSHLTGRRDYVTHASDFYRGIYTGISNNGILPNIIEHHQTANLNAFPPQSPSGETWDWSAFGTGSSGTHAWIVPDYGEVNENFAGPMVEAAASGINSVLYNLFPYQLASGSSLAVDYSGYDLAVKPLASEDVTYGPEVWSNFTQNISTVGVFNETDTNACFGPPITAGPWYTGLQHLIDVSGSWYHDTLGNFFAYGCLAKEHKYRVSGEEVTYSHPRARYSRFFNNRTIDRVNTARDMLTGAEPMSSVGQRGLNELLQASEFPVDSLTKSVPMSIPIGMASRVFTPSSIRTAGDPFRTDLYAEVDAGGLGAIFLGANFTPPYKLAVPMYSMVYEDRTLLCDFSAAVFTNWIDLSGRYFAQGPITGYSSVGVPQYADYEHEDRVANIRQWHYSNFASHFNRLHVFQYPLHSLRFEGEQAVRIFRNGENDIYQDPILSGFVTEEDPEVIFTSSQWSGYLSDMTQLIAIQALEPDYLYHGQIDHPFDEFYTPAASGGITNCSRKNRVAFSEPGTGVIDEAVYHRVRKNRNNNNRTFIMSNWTRDTQNFTGVFDPATYDLNAAYDVYSIDVSDSATRGTKTKIASVGSNASYTFDLTLNPGQVEFYEIQEITSLRTELFTNFVLDYVPVRYSYGVSQFVTSSTSIAYSYSSSTQTSGNSLYVGYQAPATQSIVNNLPQWMEMRQNRDSQGWNLNNAWGSSLEDLVQYTTEQTTDLHLETANEYHRSKIYTVEVVDQDLVAPEFTNLLFNSAFTIPDNSIYSLPAGWTDYNKSAVKLVDGKSLVGGHSVLIEGFGALGQTVELNTKVDQLTASVYIYAPDLDTDVKIIVAAETIDSTNKLFEASITTRSQEWRRLVLPMSIKDEIYRLQFTVVSNSAGKVYLNCPQLELNDSATNWTRGVADTFFFYPDAVQLNAVEVRSQDGKAIPVFPIATEFEFINAGIPTRVEPYYKKADSTTAFASPAYGRKVSFHNEIFPVAWEVQDNKIAERAIFPTPYDVFGKYETRNVRYKSDGRIITELDSELETTLIHSTVRQDYIFALCTEQRRGKSQTTVKIIRPESPNSNYMEVMRDFKLDLNLEQIVTLDQVSEVPTSIGFDAEDSTIMVVNTNLGRRFLFKLYFDYYYYSVNLGRIYTLEQYGSAGVQIL